MKYLLPLATSLALIACGGNESIVDDTAELDANGTSTLEERMPLPVDIDTDAAKLDEVGATTCPSDDWLDLAGYGTEDLPDTNMDAGDWLEANAAREGVETAESGLQYRIIQPGIDNSVIPQIDDEVKVMYHGYFPDGSVFDSSYQRGEPISFQPGQVIAGWTEALRDMRPCEARILYIPGDLAYGPRGRPGIPPNATLLFNVQMLEVD